MKRMLLSLLFVMFISLSFSQPPSAVASSDISATIIAPIYITKNLDMYFGNIASGNTAGTVTLTPLSIRTNNGGTILPGITGLVQASKFTVGGPGHAGFNYNIYLPNLPITLTRGGGSETMTVSNFVSTPSENGQLISGSQEIFVGATLNVNANQTPGEYYGEYEVRVSFN